MGALTDAAVHLLLEHIPFPAAIYSSDGALIANNDLLHKSSSTIRSLFASYLQKQEAPPAEHPLLSFVKKAMESSFNYYEGVLTYDGYIISIRCNIHTTSRDHFQDLIACFSVRSISGDQSRSPTSRA